MPEPIPFPGGIEMPEYLKKMLEEKLALGQVEYDAIHRPEDLAQAMVSDRAKLMIEKNREDRNISHLVITGCNFGDGQEVKGISTCVEFSGTPVFGATIMRHGIPSVVQACIKHHPHPRLARLGCAWRILWGLS